MTYAEASHMVDRFGERELIQLTVRPGVQPAAAVDGDRLGAALKDGFDLINGYLGKRYPLPLSPVPSLAVRWNCDLARWFLQPGQAPEMVKANYERTLEELRQAADGELSLGLEEGQGQAAGGDVYFAGPRRKFKDMKGY